MRKRNLEFNNNIDELTEEIKSQDLEVVNGGEDGADRATPAIGVVTKFVSGAIATHTISKTYEKLTKKADCGDVFSVTVECGCPIHAK